MWVGPGDTKAEFVHLRFANNERAKRTKADEAALWVQAFAAMILVVGLALHLAEVGLIGLLVIILITSFTGVTGEHQIGKAFQESLPFTSLLVVFFAVVVFFMSLLAIAVKSAVSASF